MNRQHGNTLIIYAVLALAILAALAGIYAKGYSAGKDSKQAEWDQANQKAEAEALAERQRRETAARAASGALQSAQRDATTYRARWQAERAKSPVLASCGPVDTPTLIAPVDTRSNAVAAGSQPADRVRLTADFVRLWDGAWTSETGQPVFGDIGGSAGEAATASPAEVLDNHAENAARCSATSRQLNRLIDLIRKLQG